MNFYKLSQDLEACLKENTEEEILFEKLDIIENNILDMEADKKLDKNDLLKSTEVIDSIRMILEDDEKNSVKLHSEIENLVKILFEFDRNSEKQKKGGPNKEEFMSARPEFISHPYMEKRLPLKEDAREKEPPADLKEPFPKIIMQSAPRRIPLEKPDISEIVTGEDNLKNLQGQFKHEMKFDKALQKLSEAKNLDIKYIITQPEFDFHHHIGVKIGTEGLREVDIKSSPLFNFLEIAKEFSSKDLPLSGFTDIVKKTVEEIMDIIKEDTGYTGNGALRDELYEILSESLDILQEIKETSEDEDFEEILPSFLKEIRNLNRNYIELQKEFVRLSSEEVEDESEDLLDKIESKIPEEEFITTNYIKIRDSVSDFFEEKIEVRELISIFNEMKETIEQVRQKYEGIPISEDEWTLEVYTGDKLLTEGLNEWEVALDMLEECALEDEEEEIDYCLEKLYEANRKLVLNQHLSKYIDEQVKMKKKFAKLFIE